MRKTLKEVVRDYLTLKGESPDLLPVLEEGEDSAVLTLADALRVRLPAAAAAATVMTPSALLGDVARESPLLFPPDFLKHHGPGRYIPRPVFDGETLEMGEAAYHIMMKELVG